MAVIGCFGTYLVFETSDAKIFNFNGLKRTVSGRWATHERIGLKPLKQFLGPGADQITFTVKLDAQHGIRPKDTLELIGLCVSYGLPGYLVIGNRRVGVSRFVVTQMSETWDCVWNGGELVQATVELTLEEYPD